MYDNYPHPRLYVTETGRKSLHLIAEKAIRNLDGETSEYEGHILMEWLGVNICKFVFTVERRRSVIDEGLKRCLLAMKDAHAQNNGGILFGFITTGKFWRMIFVGKDSMSTLVV